MICQNYIPLGSDKDRKLFLRDVHHVEQAEDGEIRVYFMPGGYYYLVGHSVVEFERLYKAWKDEDPMRIL